tara:strand:+ start:4222 stop:4437 length:216 start_codon:yes stop_codon:yes gene_type:complete
MGLHNASNTKKIKIYYMNVQVEFIKGFLLGIDLIEDVEHTDFENGDVLFDLFRISLGIIFIHIPFNVRDSQ